MGCILGVKDVMGCMLGISVTDMGFGSTRQKHSGLDLMLFNRLRESWRTSPESWHLSRMYNTITYNHTWRTSPESWHLSREHITSGTWRTSPESWHLSREYITSVQYTYMVRPKRHSRPGYVSPGENTHIRPTGGPLSPRHTGFRQPPQGPAWPRGNYLHDF